MHVRVVVIVMQHCQGEVIIIKSPSHSINAMPG
jgi:hypothetical protein